MASATPANLNSPPTTARRRKARKEPEKMPFRVKLFFAIALALALPFAHTEDPPATAQPFHAEPGR